MDLLAVNIELFLFIYLPVYVTNGVAIKIYWFSMLMYINNYKLLALRTLTQSVRVRILHPLPKIISRKALIFQWFDG
ncbi:hypothetical protein OBV_17050 [Oscillibacter valericigenes Sjm18-20]|nr:hypothetical protein OBV_17050 [Oscillibacter valericigenes Sjm18-20]